MVLRWAPAPLPARCVPRWRRRARRRRSWPCRGPCPLRRESAPARRVAVPARVGGGAYRVALPGRQHPARYPGFGPNRFDLYPALPRRAEGVPEEAPDDRGGSDEASTVIARRGYSGGSLPALPATLRPSHVWSQPAAHPNESGPTKSSVSLKPWTFSKCSRRLSERSHAARAHDAQVAVPTRGASSPRIPSSPRASSPAFAGSGCSCPPTR